MVWGDYWVMDIAEDYSTVLIGTPDRHYLWRLSRQPTLPASQVQAWLVKARAQGFDTQAVCADSGSAQTVSGKRRT